MTESPDACRRLFSSVTARGCRIPGLTCNPDAANPNEANDHEANDDEANP